MNVDSTITINVGQQHNFESHYAFQRLIANNFKFDNDPGTVPPENGVIYKYDYVSGEAIASQIYAAGYDASTANTPGTSVINSNVTEIKEFENKTEIESLIISNTVTDIADNSFNGCTNLTSLTFSETSVLETIGISAFENTSLNSFTLPDSVTTIKNSAFKNSNLTSFTLSANSSLLSFGRDNIFLHTTFGTTAFSNFLDSVNTIINQIDTTENTNIDISGTHSLDSHTSFIHLVANNFKFPYSSGLKGELGIVYGYSVNDNVVSALDVKSFDVTSAQEIPGQTGQYYVTILNEYDGAPITTIRESAFANATELKSVTIGQNILTIGDFAFQGTGVTDLTIPNSVQTIGASAFEDSSLTSLTIPNSVTTIGDAAFKNSSFLTSIELGDSVTTIGTSAFEGTNLSREAYDALILKLYDLAVTNSTLSMVPINVDQFHSFEVHDEFLELQELDSNINFFPNDLGISVEGGFIYDENEVLVAYSDDSSTTSYVIKSSCTGIHPNSLTNFTRSGLSISFESGSLLDTIGSSAFQGATGLTAISLPLTVTSLGNSAFQGATGLTSISLPTGIVSIGNSAFEGCSNLVTFSFEKSMEIPGNITLGTAVFKGCSSLSSTFENPLIFPTNKNTVPEEFFRNCTSLTYVDFGERENNNLTIEAYAFAGSGILNLNTTNSKIVAIGNNAYEGCISLESIHFSINLETLGNNVFKDIETLTDLTFEEIELPSSILSIGTDLFTGTPNITVSSYDNFISFLYTNKDNFPEGTKRIHLPQQHTVYKHDEFTTLQNNYSFQFPLDQGILPNRGVIYSDDFTKVIGFDNVTMEPTGIIEILEGPTTIDFDETKLVSTMNIDIERLIMSNTITTFIDRTLGSIGTFEDFSRLKEIVFGTGMTVVPSFAFRGCTNLEAANNIQNTLTTIGRESFRGCTNLNTLNLGTNLVTIGISAFQECLSLTSFSTTSSSGGGKLTTLEDSCFMTCISLNEVNLNDTITTIGENAFRDCIQLESFTLDEGISTNLNIGHNAFLNTNFNSQTYNNFIKSLFTIFSTLLTIEADDNNPGFSDETTIIEFSTQNIDMPHAVSVHPKFLALTSPENESKPRFMFPNDTGLAPFEGLIYDNDLNVIGVDRESLESIAMNNEGEREITVYQGSPGIKANALYHLNGSTDSQGIHILYIPASVLIIEENGLRGLPHLREVYFHEEEGQGVQRIAAHGISNCSNLTSIIFNGTSEEELIFEESALSGLTSLESFSLPDRVKKIGNYCFEGSNLKYFQLSEHSKLAEIGILAFRDVQFTQNVYDNMLLSLYKINTNFSKFEYSRLDFSGQTYLLPNSVEKIATPILKHSLGETVTHSMLDPTRSPNDAFNEINALKNDSGGSYLQIFDDGVVPFGGAVYDTNLEILGKDLDSLPDSKILTFIERTIGVRDEALQGYTDITEVVFGRNETYIGVSAFQDCSNLVAVDIPGSVETIGNSCFSGCTSLRQFSIHAGSTGALLNSLGTSVFLNTDLSYQSFDSLLFVLHDVQVNNMLQGVLIDIDTEHSFDAHQHYSALRDAGFSFPNDDYQSYDNSDPSTGNRTGTSPRRIRPHNGVIYLTNLDAVNFHPESLTAGHLSFVEGCQVIHEDAFRYGDASNNIKTIEFSSTIMTIKSSAFRGLLELINLTFPVNLEVIGSSAFRSCGNLTSISFPELYKLTDIGISSFHNCNNLETVQFGEISASSGLTLHESCFRNTNIITFEVPTVVKRIEDGAFQNQSDSIVLENFQFAASSQLENIGNSVFINTRLTQNSYDNVLETLADRVDTQGLQTVGGSFLPVHLDIEQVYSFEQLTNRNFLEIRGFTFSDQGVSAVDGLVYNNEGDLVGYNLQHIDGVNNVPTDGVFTVKAGTTIIRSQALKGLQQLTRLNFDTSSTLLIIENNAFEGTGLTSFVVPSNIEILSNSCFLNCNSLVNITLNPNLLSIGSSCFSGCSALTNVTFNENDVLETLGDECFFNCSSLEGFMTPHSVTTFGIRCFAGCTAIGTTPFQLPINLTQIGENCFDGFGENTNDQNSSQPAFGVTEFDSFLEQLFLIAITNENFHSSSEIITININSAHSLVTSTGVNINDLFKALRENINGQQRFEFINFNVAPYLGAVYRYNDLAVMGPDKETLPNTKVLTIFGGSQEVLPSAFYMEDTIEEIENIEAIIFPSTMKYIRTNAFQGMSNLQTIQFASQSSDLLIIESFAFRINGHLNNIVLPTYLSSIGTSAFSFCNSLTTFSIAKDSNDRYFEISLETVGENIFEDCNLDVPSYSEFLRMLHDRREILIGTGSIDYQWAENLKHSFEIHQIYKNLLSQGFLFGSGSNGRDSGIVPTDGIIYDHNFDVVGFDVNYNFELNDLTINVRPPCKNILQSAFQGLTQVRSIILSNILQTIGVSAFEGMTALESIIIPENVTAIFDSAFRNCTALTTTLFLGDLVTTIGNFAFSNTKLKSFHLPDSVETLGNSVFQDTNTLEEFFFNMTDGSSNLVSLGNSIFSNTNITFENYNLFIERLHELATRRSIVGVQIDIHQSHTFENDSKIRDLTTQIDPFIFVGPGLQSIGGLYYDQYNFIRGADPQNVPTNGDYEAIENVAGIADDAFHGYIGSPPFRSLRIPANNNFVRIGERAFQGQTSLLSIVIEGEIPSLQTIDHSAFEGCTFLEVINAGRSLQIIGNRAFGNCTQFSGLDITGADELRSIGTDAFSGAGFTVNAFNNFLYQLDRVKSNFTGLTHIDIVQRHSLTDDLGEYSLVYNNALKSLVASGKFTFQNASIKPYQGIEYDIDLNAVALDTDFFVAQEMTIVTIIPDCISIGTNAFSTKTDGSSETVKTVQSQFTSISLPTSGTFTQIQENGLKDLTGLETLTLPSSVVLLGTGACMGCSSLQSVTLNNENLVELGISCFQNCVSLQSADIPNSVQKIKQDCFNGCSSMTNLTLGVSGATSLKQFGLRAIQGTNLSVISYSNVLRSLFEDALQRNNIIEYHEATGIHVPTIDVVSPHTWDVNYIYLELIEAGFLFVGTPTISPYKGIRYSPNLTVLEVVDPSISAPDIENVYIIETGATTIANEAFSHVSFVKEVYVPNSVNSIETSDENNGAFRVCENLTTVVFQTGSSIRIVPDHCFWGCSLLRNINFEVLPLESIGINAFRGTNLIEIEIPPTVKIIGNAAFKQINTLSTLRFGMGTPLLEDTAANSFEGTVFSVASFDYLLNIIHETLNNNFQNAGNAVQLEIVQEHSLSNAGIFQAIQHANIITFPSENINISPENGIIYQHILDDNDKPSGKLRAVAFDEASFSSSTTLEFVNNTSEISDGAFSSTNLGSKASLVTSIVLPDITGELSLKTIGVSAFQGLSNVETLFLPDSIEGIGDHAFSGLSLTQTAYDNLIEYLNSKPEIPGISIDIAQFHSFEVHTAFENLLQRGFHFDSDLGIFTNDGLLYDNSINLIGYNINAVPDHKTHFDIRSQCQRISAEALKGFHLIETINLPEGLETIGTSAFEDCTNLQSFDFSQIYTSNFDQMIPPRCFFGCTSLRSVILDQIQILGDSCFENSGISELTMSIYVQSIGNAAFRRCYGLQNISWPTTEENSQLNSFGTSVFEDTGLSTFGYDNLISFFHIVRNQVRLLTTDDPTPEDAMLNGNYIIIDVQRAHSFHVNFKLLDLMNLHFQFPFDLGILPLRGIRYNIHLQVIGYDNETALENGLVGEIAEGVTKILSGALRESPFVKLVLPRTLVTMDVDALRGPNPEANSVESVLSSITFREPGVIDPTGLAATSNELVLKTIGDHAFQDLTHLDEFLIPKSVENIGTRAFFNTPELSSLRFQSITNDLNYVGAYFIGNSPLLGVSSYDSILLALLNSTVMENSHVIKPLIYSIESTHSVTTHHAFLELQKNNFLNNDDQGLEPYNGIGYEYNLSDPYRYLMAKGTNVTSRANLTDPNTLTLFEETTSIKTNGFLNETEIASFHFPLDQSFQVIFPSGLDGMSNVSTLVLPKTLKRIESGAFQNMTGLTNVSFEGTSASALEYFSPFNVFNNTPNLSQTSYDNIIEYLYSCKEKLKTTMNDDLPIVLTIAQKHSFSVNDKFVTLIDENIVIFENDLGIPPTGGLMYNVRLDVIGGDEATLPSGGGVTILNGATKILSEALKNISYITSITIPSNVMFLEDSCCFNMRNLEKVIFLEPENSKITEIARDSFAECKSLRDVVNFGSLILLNKIRHSAFAGCIALISIEIPGTVEFIDTGAFENCVLLRSVTFFPLEQHDPESTSPESSLTQLGARCFRNCLALSILRIPATVTHLGEQLADGCLTLSDFELPLTPSLSSLQYIGIFALRQTSLTEASYSELIQNLKIIYDTNQLTPAQIDVSQYHKSEVHSDYLYLRQKGFTFPQDLGVSGLVVGNTAYTDVYDLFQNVYSHFTENIENRIYDLRDPLEAGQFRANQMVLISKNIEGLQFICYQTTSTPGVRRSVLIPTGREVRLRVVGLCSRDSCAFLWAMDDTSKVRLTQNYTFLNTTESAVDILFHVPKGTTENQQISNEQETTNNISISFGVLLTGPEIGDITLIKAIEIAWPGDPEVVWDSFTEANE